MENIRSPIRSMITVLHNQYSKHWVEKRQITGKYLDTSFVKICIFKWANFLYNKSSIQCIQQSFNHLAGI